MKTMKSAIAGLGAAFLLAAPAAAATDAAAVAAGAVQQAHMQQGGQGGDMMGGGMMGPGMGEQGITGFGACPGYGGGAAPTGPGMMGSGMMGPGMMGSGMMGSGMMGPGMGGQGMTGPGMQGDLGLHVVPSKDLSTDDVRHFLEHRLAVQGNERLKVGEVKEADDDTILADIVTVDDSLVRRWAVDRHTGAMRPAE
ncbi:MAG: hypothetical protein WD099_01805 [Dongiaceae bacterium]